MVYLVVMDGCESWTIKKAEHQRIDVFELWCWTRFLRAPWTARRSNQSLLKEISPGCSLEGLMLKLKLQYFGHLMQRADSFEQTLMLGKIEGQRRGDDRGWDGWMASPTQWTWVWVNSGSWWWTGRPGVLRFMGLQSQTRLSKWTELIHYISSSSTTHTHTFTHTLCMGVIIKKINHGTMVLHKKQFNSNLTSRQILNFSTAYILS